jgi:transposase
LKGRHAPEQIIRKLREADRILAEGKSNVEIAKALEVTEWTTSRWQSGRAIRHGKRPDVRTSRAWQAPEGRVLTQFPVASQAH